MKSTLDKIKNTQISQRDKRALILAIIVCLGVAGYLLLESRVAKWQISKTKYQTNMNKIKTLASKAGQAKLKGLISVVPMMELPIEKQQQILRFSNKVNEQLKQCGIKPSSIQLIGADKKTTKLVRLKCKADCTVNQAFDLLGKLNENPFYVSIDEFSLKLNVKSRNKANITMAISTFVK